MSYDFLKFIHVSFVGLTFVSFSVRAVWTLQQSKRLQEKWVRVVPHFIDTILLVSAVLLAIEIEQYPATQPWLAAKLVALVAYIILGTYALKRGKTQQARIRALIGAYICFFYIAAVALTRNPLLLL